MSNLVALLGYIDPSSGSLGVQFLIAAVAGTGIALRQYLVWPFVRAIRLMFGRQGARDE